jgi:hypothetical protein
MAFFNGQERTTTDLRDLLDQTGWKLLSIQYDKLSNGKDHKAIAVPI